jgi:hypothetical protein
MNWHTAILGNFDAPQYLIYFFPLISGPNSMKVYAKFKISRGGFSGHARSFLKG